MALYQPSFMVPRNQAIDATNQEDMTFTFQLNGNNLLCAYNIQIFDNDSNNLVYELVSTENQRAIQERINELTGYISNQDAKMDKIEENEQSYSIAELKTKFRDTLKKDIVTLENKLNEMQKIITAKNKGELDPAKYPETDIQTQITKYFQYWGDIVTTVKSRIGEEQNPMSNSGEYIIDTLEDWVNIDPARTDGITYKDENKELLDLHLFDVVKDEYSTLRKYYEDTVAARIQSGSTDTTYISTTTYEKAKRTAYLMYSEFSDKSYFAKDLYSAIDNIWNNVGFNELKKEIDKYNDIYMAELSQQEYALAHLNGGITKQAISAYKSASASEANVAFEIPQGGEVAVIDITPQPASGWKYIIYEGKYGYVQSTYIKDYNISEGKYYLEKPIAPINYNGEQNTISHQLPIDILENGKAYKWSATLYWSTSGKYNEDDKVDGSLTSIENYFDTRKKPVVSLANIKQIFTIPFNYVKVVKETTISSMDDNNEMTSVTIKAGEQVLFLHLYENDENIAYIQYIDSKDNKTYQGYTQLSNLEGTGIYDTKNYVLQSKKATFIGNYEQEQFVSISYFRWILYKLQYDTEEITEVVKDTGMVPSIDFKFFYDGFLNEEKYGIKLFVQTLDNVEVETELIKFKVSYIDVKIENMVNAENSPIEHGIIVEWSNLRLINGKVEGTYTYEQDVPVEGRTALTLDKGATLTFDRDKEAPLSIDWDANHIVSLRFDEERPTESQLYYRASGLDDNGEVIIKQLTMIPRNDTQTTGIVTLEYQIITSKETLVYETTVIASKLYWYIIIMTETGMQVFTKYAKGLFPALDQYPSLNKWTNSTQLYPDALTYLEEPVDTVEYDYQTIVDRDGNPIEE